MDLGYPHGLVLPCSDLVPSLTEQQVRNHVVPDAERAFTPRELAEEVEVPHVRRELLSVPVEFPFALVAVLEHGLRDVEVLTLHDDVALLLRLALGRRPDVFEVVS